MADTQHRVPSARPTSPRLWPPAIRRALTTIHGADGFPHIFVTGYRADGAWWVLNGDSGGDGREYIRRSIVYSIGCAVPLQPHTCRDAAATRSPAALCPLPGFLPFVFNLAPTLYHIASTRRGIHLQLDRSGRRLALRS